MRKQDEDCSQGASALDDEAVEADDEDNSNEDTESGIPSVLQFLEGHPGLDFCELTRRKFEVIPMVSIPEHKMCRSYHRT